MKKTLVLVLAAVAAGGVARGAGAYSLSTDITFASDYVFRGVNLSDNTLHPSIEFKQEDFYLGFWGALPINNRSSLGLIDEYDFYGGYNVKLSDTLSLDVGGTYYYYTQADETLEGYIGITGNFQGLTPGLYTYYDFDLEAWTVQGSIGYSIPLQTIGTTLDLSATLGWVKKDDAAPGDVDDYLYYGVDASIPYKLNENATLTLGAHWTDNDIGSVGGVRVKDDIFWFSAGLTIGF